MKPYQLLVFDWDGTLMDSESRIVACLQKAVEATGATARERSALSDVIGLGLDEAIRQLYPEADSVFVRRFAEAYRDQFLFEDQTPSALFEGVREVLEQLTHSNYLLAVATGKARRGLDRALDELGLAEVFHATRCADETFSKPHPQMLEEIMIDLDTPPADTLMIGDTEYDMLMASNAGAPALAVSYGVHALSRLLDHMPAGHIDAIAELPAWLDRAAAESSVA